MAKLDRASLLKTAAGMERNSSSNDNLWWKPTEGEKIVRIVPLESNPSNPLQEVYVHYLDNKSFVSPETFGDPDPFSEYSDKLIADGNGKLSKDEFKAAKQFKPTQRYYVPVVVRGEENLGVRFWGMTPAVAKELTAILLNEDFDDITDIEKGNDLRVTFTPKEKSPTKFAKTEIAVRPKTTPLHTDPAIVRALVETPQPVLLKELKSASYDELSTMLEKKLLAKVNSPTDDGWATSPAASEASIKKAPVTAAPAVRAQVATDAAEEFADIFGDD